MSSLNQCPKENSKTQEMQKDSLCFSCREFKVCPSMYVFIITYKVKVLGKYLSNLRINHWKVAKRVMTYFKRTKDYMLTYKRSNQLEIIRYSDFDFAGCQNCLRFTSSYIFMLAGGAVSWCSTKQTLTTSSIMVVEFVACYEASNQEIWLRNIMEGVKRLLELYYDNK